MAQRPISVSAMVSTANAVVVYTAPANTAAIVNNIQGCSLLGNTFTMTVNKVTTNGIVYPMCVERRSGDDSGYQANVALATDLRSAAPTNFLKGSLTLSAGESLSLSTTAQAVTRLTPTYTGNGIIYQVTAAPNGSFIAVGRNTATSPNTGLVLTSNNGSSWTRRTFSNTMSLHDVAASNTLIQAINVADFNGRWVSSDGGVTWSANTGPANGPRGIAYLNDTWLYFTDSELYTSANGTSWTLNSALNTFRRTNNSLGLRNVSWNGNNYIFSGTRGTLLGSSDLSTFTSPGYIRGGQVPRSVTYHPASTKFYATIQENSNNSLLSSTDGLNWQEVTVSPSLGATPLKILAGSQTSQTLILLKDNDLRAGLYSTNNGSTWTSFTNTNFDRPSQMMQMDNGYYIQFNYFVYGWYVDFGCCNYQYYEVPYAARVAISQTPWNANPTTNTGATAYNIDTSGYWDDWYAQSACASNTANGSWIVFGRFRDPSYEYTTHWRAAGSDGWSTSGTFLRRSTYSVNTYGAHMATVKFGSHFYMLTEAGHLFRIADSQGADLAYIGRICNEAGGMHVINNVLCITNGSSTQAGYMVYRSTDGTNFTATSVTHGGQYAVTRSSHTLDSNNLASNGSFGIFWNRQGQIVHSSNGTSWSAIPSSLVQTQTLNGNLLAQSISMNGDFTTNGYGTYAVSNLQSANGYTLINGARAYDSSNITRGSFYTMANMFAYANSKYIVTNSCNPVAVTFNANTSVNGSIDTISISNANSLFSVGDSVVYTVSFGNTALTNLASGSRYYIAHANSTTIALSATSGGANVDLTSGLTQTGHTLTVNNSINLLPSIPTVRTPFESLLVANNTINGLAPWAASRYGVATSTNGTIIADVRNESASPIYNISYFPDVNLTRSALSVGISILEVDV